MQKQKTVAKTTATILGLLLLMMSNEPKVHADGPVELRAVDVTYKRFLAPGADELIWPRTHKDGLNLDVNMDVVRFAYFNSTVMSVTDESQFRGIGLNFHTGVRLADWVSVEYEHYSKHVLEGTSSYMKGGYPLYDSANLIIHLMPSSRKEQ